MSHNTWLHKISRTVIVKLLMKTKVTPNQVTMARLITGLGATVLFLIGGERYFDLGAGLFAFSILLDRADGDLARLSGKTSTAGHRFDLISDTSSNALIFVGLGFALQDNIFGFWSIVLGLVAGVSVAIVLLLVVLIEELEGVRAAEIRGFYGFDPDDAMIIVPVIVWIGWPNYLLLAAGIGAPVFVILFSFFYRKKLKLISNFNWAKKISKFVENKSQ